MKKEFKFIFVLGLFYFPIPIFCLYILDIEKMLIIFPIEITCIILSYKITDKLLNQNK